MKLPGQSKLVIVPVVPPGGGRRGMIDERV